MSYLTTATTPNCVEVPFLFEIKSVYVSYPPPPFLWDPSGESGHCFQGIIPLFLINKPKLDQLKTDLCDDIMKSVHLNDDKRVYLLESILSQ